MKIRLPGLTDCHVHLRDPGGTHKEDWRTGTAAAIAGGFTTVLAMPNTSPPVTDSGSFETSLAEAGKKALCDYGLFIGGNVSNVSEVKKLSQRCASLKLYLDQTFGPLKLDEFASWMAHFENWPGPFPIAVHAEGKTMAAAILLSGIYKKPVHVCHVSRRDEIRVIRKAKESGFPVTCEVTPHHLFLSTKDIERIGPGRSEVRPRLASESDRDALWENLDVIDIFATDHAPHALHEKDGDNPPPGFPGLETALPLFLNACRENRISIDDIVEKMHENPRRIFYIPAQEDTYVEIDTDCPGEIRAKDQFTKCGWTPFEGWKVYGKVVQVVIRSNVVFRNGEITASPGSGIHIRQTPLNSKTNKI